MLWWFCTLLLLVMTRRRCHRRRKMIGVGAEGDCGTEERPCPVSRVPDKIPATQPENPVSSTGLQIDYYSQAKKALVERSPFDVAEETSTSTVLTLPNALANFLNRHSDSRRRHKKSHSGADKKSSRAGEKSRGSNFWIETEEYFRGLTLPDIDSLLEAASSFRLATWKYFYIPVLGNAPRPNIGSSKNDKDTDENVDSVAIKNGDVLLKTDNVARDVLPPDGKDGSTSYSSGSLEWLLGCRNKVSLTSERPSKKRKLLGGDAGLEKVLIAGPCDGDSSVCHYCSRGDTSRESNRLIVCISCKVAVHQKCYGVEDNMDGSWLCSWCKQKDDIGESVNTCVLCPKKGGALKPVNRSGENVGSVEFAHLFCCLWIPEVYIEDLKKMEPVINVGGIKETRSKLVCHVCKVKCGTCVRCSHGTCRTSFHPICAREAGHRMEVWAKYGYDNVELRAFCSKHSELQENNHILSPGGSVAVGILSSAADGLPVASSVDRTHNFKIVCKNGDNFRIHMVDSDSCPDKLSHSEPQEIGSSDGRLNSSDMSESGVQQLSNTGVVGRTNEDVNASDSLSFALVLKKLIDRGKVDARDVALEIGVSPDMLTAKLNEACLATDLRWKIVNWLRAHVYTNAFQKSSRLKLKPTNSSQDESGATDGSDTLSISDSDLLDPVAVKSVPPRRRTIGNMILKDNKMMSSSEAVSSENGMAMDTVRADQLDHENLGHSDEASIPDANEMNSKLECTFPEGQGIEDKPHKSRLSGSVPEDNFTVCLQNASAFEDHLYPVHSASESPAPGSIKKEATSSYIHPYISKKLLQIHNWMLSKDIIWSGEEGNSGLNESSKASGCFGYQNEQSTCSDICKPNQENMELLVMARKMEVPNSSPEDELEGELIYFQHRLLQNSVARNQIADNLIYTIAKRLPQEIDAACQQRWDAVLVNQYLCDLREAKKQGRKERRHKEAQAVLAAATAAAAASSRVSSFRKDAFDASGQQENSLSGRTGTCSQPMPRAKEILPRVAVARTSSEKYSDFGHPTSDISKEHPRSCDICRRAESMLNPILVCSSCKVAVHLDCYRSVKETMGPWCCELCEDLSSRSSGAPAVNFWEKPYFVAECGLCGGTTGAFRKSSDGQWVHAFCAEWAFQSTFQRGQVNAVEGMESVLKGVSICCICQRKHGVCLKCSYGHCQMAFHPSCARSAGFYMIARTTGGKLLHKAYCEKHSLEQRAKAETQKHGIEELKNIKQIRVELERLRLLCERIVKREKLKRELVLCSHDILAFRRDHVARSALVHSPFFLPDGSSESATTSLKGNTEGYRSCSEAIQRSDDVTVDSLVSGKHGVRVAVSMDADPKLDDDCSTSQSQYNHKIPERLQFSGKQIPNRASVMSCNLLDEGGCRSKSRKHAETFEKELIMTSDEASMKNLMLPKGYAYVPADCLSNDKQQDGDVYAIEPLEHDG
ncbi:hypothetical protein L6164_016134 [Bauhinia variegata]|uniref:Uncharacterized protein n=1 Tax=Bauhinia variegata TaxID=167791 RepID=A0ACB9NPT7_BAUVA|nr:hypothetical protein L6164_016134 [Bauhinia variegata]